VGEDESEDEIVQMVKLAKTLEHPTEAELMPISVCLGNSLYEKTIILDLDETLISAKASFVRKENFNLI
jgi:predicted HAD superfamily phosphohydrolase YqeG